MLNVLIVDDVENNRFALELLLEDFEGLILHEAKDGKEAIDAFEEHYLT